MVHFSILKDLPSLGQNCIATMNGVSIYQLLRNPSRFIATLALLQLAQQIKQENVSSSILAQCARPSKVPPKEKRKLDDEGEVSQSKRSKLGVE